MVHNIQNYRVYVAFHSPEFWIIIKHNVSEKGSVSVFSSAEVDTYSVGSFRNNLPLVLQLLRLSVSKGPKGAGFSLPSPKDGNRSSFRTLYFLII
jgi:hypothetical protein